MLVLGIETSCDETSVALVENGTSIKGIRTFSQVRTHKSFGGVVPEIASRIHVRVIHQLVLQLLSETGVNQNDIDLIAVTHCPGLIGALLVGVSFANAYAYSLNKPVVGINHLEAHIYAAFMYQDHPPELPSLALLVSGGHTALILVQKIGQYQLLGSTLDDAVGEAFDKTAKLLNFSYPGGPEIEKAALSGNSKAFAFPRSMTKKKDRFQFSFSGLKTAVLYEVTGTQKKEQKPQVRSKQYIQDIAASFQQAVLDILTIKTSYAVEETKAKSLIVCGGVAANQALQKVMHSTADKYNIQAFIPPLKYCTDNAAMIGGLAFHKKCEAGLYVSEVFANQLIGLNED